VPLAEGTSRAAVSSNIARMMHEHARKGRVGRSGKISKSKAREMAIAIAMKKAGKARK